MVDDLFDAYGGDDVEEYNVDIDASNYLESLEEEASSIEEILDSYEITDGLEGFYKHEPEKDLYGAMKTGSSQGTIEPVDTTPDLEAGQDPTTAGLPRDRGTTKAERRQTFQQEYADQIAYSITMETVLDAAEEIVDADPESIQDTLASDLDVTGTRMIDAIIDEALMAAEEQYVKDHMFYEDRQDQLVDDALKETMDDLLPTHRLRSDVRKVYDGQELDPRAIQRHMVRQMAHDVDETVTEYDETARGLLEGERLTAQASPDLDGELPAALEMMESRPGESVMGLQWDSSHPAVQQAAAEQLEASIGKDIQRAATGAAQASQEELEDLQDRYGTAIERFRVDETLRAMDEHWDTADMPYEVFEIDDPDEMQKAAEDIGNCRTTASGYYEDLADDPFTTVLGVRRDDSSQWIGMARAFHMETPDDEDVFAIDNLGMQYKHGHEAGHPESSCDFENYGDALPVMGLASIAFGLENGFDHVVAGRNDGRVGGGSGDRIGVAQLYSTKNTDQDELPVEKKGHRDIKRPYGLTRLNDPSVDQKFALLMENPGTGPA